MTQAKLKVVTLGGLKLYLGDEPIANLGSRKAEALLLYLVSTQKRQAREVLADLLWDERPQRQALTNLRVVLTHLRKHFEPFLIITRESVALNPEAVIEYDVAGFEKHLNVLNDPSTFPAERVEKAVQRYQGEFLEGFYVRESPRFDQWMVQERERLHQLALSGLSNLAAYYLEKGEVQRGIACATRLLELNPLMESAHRQMMRLLALSGKRALALKQFETLAELLVRELGIEPEDESRKIYEEIQSGRFPGETAQPETSQQKKPRHNLPTALTPLVGRDVELEQVRTLLENPTCRLVTMVGPGGIGKTRLALQAAERLQPAFPQGVWFVRLDALDAADNLPEAIATSLGLPLSRQATPAEQLLGYLQPKNLLLVLDNFEQLLPEGTEVLVEILQETTGVKLLVTSREKLNLGAEWLYEVQGLEFPAESSKAFDGYPGVELFVQRARQASGRALPDAELPCVAQIARLVDGSPLALELAATWTRALSCREIADEIERGLGILQANQPDLPARHRSMRAAFEQSWQLLSKDERTVFRRLAVFRGGFERQAAEQVTGASLDTLAALVDKSLVQRDPGGRYRLHELLRQYAAGELERAGEFEETRERHLAYYLQLAEEAEPQLWRNQQNIWLVRLESEHDNLRKAIEWSLSTHSTEGVQVGLRLVAALEQYILQRGHYNEAIVWIDKLLANPLAPSSLKYFADVLRIAAGLNHFAFGKNEKARELFERSLLIAEQLDDPLLLAHVLSDFGVFYLNTDWLSPFSEAFAKRSLDLYRELGYQPGIATALRRMGQVAGARDFDITASSSYHQESVQVWKELGNNLGIAHGYLELARVCIDRRDFVKARDYLKKSLGLYREVNDPFVNPRVYEELGKFEFVFGNLPQAIEYFENMLAIALEFNEQSSVIDALLCLGEVSRFQEDNAKAYAYYQEALAVAQKLNKMKEGCALICLGFLFLRQGELDNARQHLEKGLRLQNLKIGIFSALALIGLAGQEMAESQGYRAARLLGAAERLLEINNTDLTVAFRSFLPDYERIKAEIIEQFDSSTFKDLVAEGRAMTEVGMDRVVEYALGVGSEM